jgi:hypothetical protein
MTDQHASNRTKTDLKQLTTDAASYFARASEAVAVADPRQFHTWRRAAVGLHSERDMFWTTLTEELQARAKALADRLILVMAQIVGAAKSAPLVSGADRRDLEIGTKAMRAALLLRRYQSWDGEVLRDEEGTVIGTKPARQSENEPLLPAQGAEIFADWVAKIDGIVDLISASTAFDGTSDLTASDAVPYLPRTAFIMMWMDKSNPELTDVCDAVKEVFDRFDIRAVRADDIEHNGLITRRVLAEIKSAEFCFADLSGSRPNVYYEVGYAHALERPVFLYRKAGTGFHFDLAGHNCPEYDNLRDLKEKLTQRLKATTNRDPRP